MKAIPFEENKRMPRLQHATMAVINPAHESAPHPATSRPPDMQVVATTMKLSPRKLETSRVREHLTSPPDLCIRLLIKSRWIAPRMARTGAEKKRGFARKRQAKIGVKTAK